MEAKAAGPTADLRLGLQKEFGVELGKAMGKQIVTTVERIRERHPKFARKRPGSSPPETHPGKTTARWRCSGACGTEATVTLTNIRRGRTRCGTSSKDDAN